MISYKVNPAIKKFKFSIVISAEILQKKGFDFDITDQEAENYAVTVNIYGATAFTMVELNTWADQLNNLSNGVCEDTGDDEGTINDIIELLNEGKITINPKSDMSVDENGNFVETFIAN